MALVTTWASVDATARPSELSTTRANGSSPNSWAYAASEGSAGTSRGVADRPLPGLIDVTTAQTNGNSITSAPRITTTCSTTDRAVRLRSRIGDPPPLAADLDHGDREDDGEQQPGQRSGVARLAVPERERVHPQHDRLRRVVGAAARHRVDLVEDLEAVDERDDDDEERRGGQQRQDDRPQPPPPAGAVDARGLDELRRDRLEPGQQDDHDEAEV